MIQALGKRNIARIVISLITVYTVLTFASIILSIVDSAGVVWVGVIIGVMVLPPLLVSSGIARICSTGSKRRQKRGRYNLPRGSRLDLQLRQDPLPKLRDTTYNRQTPTDDIYISYWVAYRYRLLQDQTGLIGARILKWIAEGDIVATKKEGLLGGYVLDTKNVRESENPLDKELLDILKTASGKNGILETFELQRWCLLHRKKVRNFYDHVEAYVIGVLETGRLLDVRTAKSRLGIEQKMYSSTPELKAKAVELIGLKKFLTEFSSIGEREISEVERWGDYLVYAQLLGISVKTDKQLDKLLPQFNFSDIKTGPSIGTLVLIWLAVSAMSFFGFILVILYYKNRYER